VPDVIPPNQNSLEDTIKVLDATYQDGLNYRKRALSGLEDYVNGKYVDDEDGSRTITPKINYMYKTWFLVVAKLLTYNVVPRRLRHDFMKSEATYDLDEYLFNNDFTKAEEDIEQAYSNSLEALSVTIDDLRNLKKSASKTISLRKVGHMLYVHVEPDDIDEVIHKFHPQSTLESMFDYIYSHPKKTITSGEIEFATQSYDRKRPISEDLRTIGFDDSLKNLLFSKCTFNEVRLRHVAKISQKELSTLLDGLRSE
jgi:hypothetical protein